MASGKTPFLYIGIGANLAHPDHGGPLETCQAAVQALAARGLAVAAQSLWYESAPVPVSDQPWFVNGVVAVETDLAAADVMVVLHTIEADFGRVRGARNAARTLDLDLLDFRGRVIDDGAGPVVPHPRMADRAFVLLPLSGLAPEWVHPVSGVAIADLIRALPKGQDIRPVKA